MSYSVVLIARPRAKLCTDIIRDNIVFAVHCLCISLCVWSDLVLLTNQWLNCLV